MLYFLLDANGYLSHNAMRSSICCIFSHISMCSTGGGGGGGGGGRAIEPCGCGAGKFMAGKIDVHIFGIDGGGENKDCVFDGTNGVNVIFINGLGIVVCA